MKRAVKSESMGAAHRVGARLVKQHIYSKFLPKSWYTTYTPKQLVKGEYKKYKRQVVNDPFAVAGKAYKLLRQRGNGKRKRRVNRSRRRR